MAGRSAKCGCGAKLVVPSEPPAAGTSSGSTADSSIPVKPAAVPAAPATSAPAPASSDACPSCNAPLASGAVLCVNCGYNLKTGQKLAAVVVETEQETDGGESEDNADAADEQPDAAR
jgi:hypothetical protein